jgi:iron complex outermembrane receptor protein
MPKTQKICSVLAIVGTFASTANVCAEDGSSETEPFDHLNLSELMEVKITSVGRKASPRFYAPSAIDVLTEEDIRRYGATTLPDTLRIVPGLHVARYIGNGYSITSRGFGSAAANKMQVLMDGRSLYTPLFSGVFWEVQDALLLDLDRVEVIRGPGATMWGANAVNGVINFMSKSARDTQGLLLEGGGGNEELGFGAVRYGDRVGENTFWRVYSKYRYRDEQKLSDGRDGEDFSEHWQSGFRTDTYARDVHQFTVQGDFYLNDFGSLGRDDASSRGGNLLGRWTRTFSDSSDLQLQVYFDRGDREVPLQYKEERSTGDLDLQHRFQIGERNDIVWGGNYRISADQTGSRGTYSFDPPERTIELFSGFVQDEITLVHDRLTLTPGIKFEHNDFTGFEIQPSARLSYIPKEDQVIWAAVSRAVRTPTRIESDVRFGPNPGGPPLIIRGNPEFNSEDLLAYELGYRIRPVEQVTFELGSFYNVYENLRTLEPSATVLPLTLMNEREGNTYGFETTLSYEVLDSWRVSGSYSLLKEDLEFTSRSQDASGGTAEANDPNHMGLLRSSLTLPHRIEFDQVLRYVDSLPNPRIPSYVELDLRLAWRPKPGLELALIGMNLLDSSHPEFNGGSGFQTEVERSVYARMLWLY